MGYFFDSTKRRASVGKLISYAQNREDLYLFALLGHVKKGFYVDVGANHPVQDSVTKLFYEKGWRGINIEPNQDLLKEIKYDRPEDINLGVGVGEKAGKEKFRIYPDQHGFSTLDGSVKNDHKKESLKHKDVVISIEPLSTILEKRTKKSQKIDFLKIDVEGYEKQVILSNDWKKYRPTVVVVEAAGYGQWEKLITQEDYQKVFFDGLNNYYVAKEAGNKVSIHNFSKNVLKPGYYTNLESYLISENESLSESLKDLQEKHDIIAKEVERMSASRIHPSHIVKAVRRKLIKRK